MDWLLEVEHTKAAKASEEHAISYYPNNSNRAAGERVTFPPKIRYLELIQTVKAKCRVTP